MKFQSVLSQNCIMHSLLSESNSYIIQQQSGESMKLPTGLIRVKARKPASSNYASISSHPSNQSIEIISSIINTNMMTFQCNRFDNFDCSVSSTSFSSQQSLVSQQVIIEEMFERNQSRVQLNLSSTSNSYPVIKKTISKKKSVEKKDSNGIFDAQNRLTASKIQLIQADSQQMEAQNLLSNSENMLRTYMKLSKRQKDTFNRTSLLEAASLLTSSSKMGQELSSQIVAFPSFDMTVVDSQTEPAGNLSSQNYSSLAFEESEDQDQDEIDQIQQRFDSSSQSKSLPAFKYRIQHNQVKQIVKQKLADLFSLKPNDPSLLQKYVDNNQDNLCEAANTMNSPRKQAVSLSNNPNSHQHISSSHTGEDDENRIEPNNQGKSSQRHLETFVSKKSRHSKFHNFNKLFMYKIMKMLQADNFVNLRIPEDFAAGIYRLVTRVKLAAKKKSNSKEKYSFDYYSHIHYNLLFLRLTSTNIPLLANDEESLLLYEKCFSIDLKTAKVSDINVVYANLIKAYVYQIFEACSNEKQLRETSQKQSDPKLVYTLKVIDGIQKLAAGTIIKRF